MQPDKSQNASTPPFARKDMLPYIAKSQFDTKSAGEGCEYWVGTGSPLLQRAVEYAVSAISDSLDQVLDISESTAEQVAYLEQEHTTLKLQVQKAIAGVEQIEKAYREARNHLVEVNRNMRQNNEQSMQAAYSAAERLQVSLGQMREREVQLKLRRDDVARRLKALRRVAQQAEVLTIKFQQMSIYLRQEYESAARAESASEEQSLIGLKLLQLQEEERRQLAERLHDNVMQAMASLAMRAQSARYETLAIRELMRTSFPEIVAELRQVVFDLRPPLLDDLGLVPTLRRYLGEWGTFHNKLHDLVLIGIETPLSPTEKVTLFRVVQEGLRNIREHAPAAERVTVRVIFSEFTVGIEIQNAYTGEPDVNFESYAQTGRMGLTLCRQRLAALGGGVALASVVEGVILRLSIPRRKESPT